MNTRELTKEEADALSADLTEVLVKHNCEIGVISSIQLLKRVEEETNKEDIKSPFMPKNGDNNTTTEETPKTD